MGNLSYSNCRFYCKHKCTVYNKTLHYASSSVVVTKSDGTAITTLSVIAGSPISYRPPGVPDALAANTTNTVYTDRGLIFTSTIPVAVSIRNVESD